MDLDKAIEKRHSVRRFTSKKAKWQDIIEAVDAANKTPLAGNVPAVRFILVSDREEIEKIAEAAQQNFLLTVDYLVVVCSKTEELVRSYDERGEIYARQQAGASIQNFLLKITDLGLASCWVGAFVDAQVKSILNIPEEINVEAILPVGYEMPKTGKQRKKTDLDNVLYFNKWKEKYMKPIKNIEAE